MTSGTPESTQNCVLSGFQNCLDRSSISALDGKAISPSAMSPPGSGRQSSLLWSDQIRTLLTFTCQEVKVKGIFHEPKLLSRFLPADTVRAGICTTRYPSTV